MFEWLEQRSAIPVFPLGLGDQNVAESKNGGQSIVLHGISWVGDTLVVDISFFFFFVCG